VLYTIFPELALDCADKYLIALGRNRDSTRCCHGAEYLGGALDFISRRAVAFAALLICLLSSVKGSLPEMGEPMHMKSSVT